MKLNNKGWGLQELLLGIGILFFGLLIVVSLINRNFKRLAPPVPTESDQKRPVQKEYESYKEIEAAMKKAAIQYNKTIYGADLQEGDNITVTLKSLVRDDYIEQVYDIKDSKIVCSGYVTFIKENNKVTYSPYLKCGKKYKTKGYLERLDAKIDESFSE